MFLKTHYIALFFLFLTNENTFAQNFYSLPYTGKIRAGAKTSVSKGRLHTYDTVGDFLASLPTDGYMRKNGINNNSLRTRDEDMNIFIKNASIFHIKKEEDNDLHVIIGDVVDGVKTNLLTIEIAGLPRTSSPDYNTLLEARKSIYYQFQSFFDSNKKSQLTRKPYPQIAVTGSLFFDNWHYAKNSDVTRPNTVFELHPVTKIVFLKK
jgi:hypothetical protein